MAWCYTATVCCYCSAAVQERRLIRQGIRTVPQEWCMLLRLHAGSGIQHRRLGRYCMLIPPCIG
eukprot:3940382-Rhodomonas_salina.1